MDKIKIKHNLYETIGQVAWDGVRSGKLDPRKVEKLFTGDVNFDMGQGYNVNLGYNKHMMDRKQDLKLSITKDF